MFVVHVHVTKCAGKSGIELSLKMGYNQVVLSVVSLREHWQLLPRGRLDKVIPSLQPLLMHVVNYIPERMKAAKLLMPRCTSKTQRAVTYKTQTSLKN